MIEKTRAVGGKQMKKLMNRVEEVLTESVGAAPPTPTSFR
jgi:hypothetical protein